MLLIAGVVVALVLLDWPWSIVTIAAAAVCELAVNVAQARWMRRRRARVGVETLLGETALALTPLEPDGQVKVNGEIWRARSARFVRSGDSVRIRAVDGLTLEVDPS
jgi:membrane protein implicated in regulation of membrane protease activity